MLAACCWRALAAEAPPEPRPIFAFDIPAQPLQAALEQYSNVTGGSVVYRAALTVGRRSTAVKGIHTPEAALRMLIEGSGLVAEYTATNAVVLQPEPAARQRGPANPTGSFYRSYYGLIQAGVRDALCGLPALAVGSFRAAVSFGVSEQGRVRDAHLLDSSGDADRDEAITQALNGIALGKAPPEGLAQPFVMLIVPQSVPTTTAPASSAERLTRIHDAFQPGRTARFHAAALRRSQGAPDAAPGLRRHGQ
ncbi:TonB C-terminal domain-containing protein [Achromobacter xylosoxidans]